MTGHSIQTELGERKLSKAKVVSIIDEANELFGTDFELTGSWARNGFSTNDIDLIYGRKRNDPDIDLPESEREREKAGRLFFSSALFIARKTGMLVDLFKCDIKIRLEDHWVVRPDGDVYIWVNRAQEEMDKEDSDFWKRGAESP